MWHKKQNVAFPGQMMDPPRPQATPVENMIVPPPFGVPGKGFLAESSRKRKATTLGQQENNFSDGIFESVLENPFHKESFSQHGNSELPAINMQSSSFGTFSSQTAQSGEPNTENTQLGNYHHHLLTNFSTTWQNKDMNLPQFAVGKMNNSIMLPQSFHHIGPPPSLKSAGEEILAVPDWQHLVHNTVSQTEVHKFPLYMNSTDACIGKAQDGTPSKDETNHLNQFATANPTMKLNSVPSESLRSSEMSEQSLVKNEKSTHLVKFDGREGNQVTSNIASSIEVRNSSQNSNTLGTENFPNVRMSSLEAYVCIEGKKNDQSCENPNSELRSGSSSSGGLGLNLKYNYQSPADQNNVKKREGSDSGNEKHTSRERISPGNADNPAKSRVRHGHEYDRNNDSLTMDAKSKSVAGKVAPPSVEKLWDGSLQLNASVTVSAVAFFKSGEKAPEINWSKFVEVKGKVRLEAFEKFIQELPRSRNRGLMVISLCWKVGSSKVGLTGMKEVAKSYKEGERVGFAQLSRGIDLYVCPRSDTIITILAKYGFFKGMAAVEEDQDSLIGCVVWRRNRTSSNISAVSKKSEGKNLQSAEQSLNSPSDSAMQQSTEINPSLTVVQGSSPLDSGVGCTPIESTGSIGTENKIVHSSSLMLGVSNSFTSRNPEPTSVSNNSVPTPRPNITQAIPVVFQSALTSSSDSSSVWGNSFTCLDPKQSLVPDNFSSNPGPNYSQAIQIGLQPALPADLSSLRLSIGQSLQAEIPLKGLLGPEKLGGILELPKPVISLPSQAVKKHIAAAADYDDLPEFDFRMACGVSEIASNKPLLSSNIAYVLNTIQFDNKVSAEGTGKVDGFMPSTVTVWPLTATSQQKLHVPTLPGLALDTNQGIPPLKNSGEHEMQLPTFPFSHGKPTVHSSDVLSRPATSKPSSGAAITAKKNLWDDDDDMPEWCPPDQEHQSQPPPIPSIPSLVPNPFGKVLPAAPRPPGKVPPAAPRPPLPSQSQVPVHLTSCPQGLPGGYQHCPVTITMKPAQTGPVGGYTQRGTSSLPGFNPNFPLRPRYNVSDMKPPIRPAGWRGWRS
ncbi:hypothetical protein NE237_025048 [Protea cynaroides]|uniref:Spen paralogue and orthologue SPOC C-terminal domain-containing protein n=1 Tax=Protea cynaroides TaxID=273540 RepID=A0A9Q0H173_9MAGN|nr:hypothetical protein NE237_025048 [Protea cynaroides]